MKHKTEPPSCRVCSKPMTFLGGDSEEPDRWYCYKDDVLIVQDSEVVWSSNRYVPVGQVRPRVASSNVTRTDEVADYDDGPPNPHLGSMECVYCFYCGGKMPSDARFCRYCGRKQNP